MENTVKEGAKVVDKKPLYEGYFKMLEYKVEDEDKVYTREIYERPNGVAAIVYDTKKEKYLFVKQFRAAVEGDMVEIVAGSLDIEGEKPEEALKREIIEEMGYKVDHMNHLKDFYVSPGASTEICSIYYVEVSEKISEGGGVGDEKIEVVEVDKLGPMGTLFWEPDEDGNMMPPYQLIDVKSIVAVSMIEVDRIIGDMANVLTQAKMRSL
jgi:nudix-type nucleoside diphosphatase (YffH/AdpP family)